MAFTMLDKLATDAPVKATTTSVNSDGLHTLTFTLDNLSSSEDFLLAAIRSYASAEGIDLKEDVHNSYLNVYLISALEVGVNALDKTTAESSANIVNQRIPLSVLVQAQAGSALYQSFEIGGLPAGWQCKYGFELVLNGVAQPDWIADETTITMGGTVVSPRAVSLIVTEVGDAVTVTIDTADTSDTSEFLLEVVDNTKAAMPELSYDSSVVLTSTFSFDPENKPVFTFTSATPNMRQYVLYDIRIRARKTSEGLPDNVSDYVVANTESFSLPWLTEFVDTNVIKGRQIEESLVGDMAQRILDNTATRVALRDALNTGSYSAIATTMYEEARTVAVSEFETICAKFTSVREQLRRIALYSEIDSSYGEVVDLTDVETRDAFTFVTKQGYNGDNATQYYSWLDKAFHLGAVVEGTVIAENKYYVTVRGSVYRDRAEILFS
jgi:hypothetical protein